ncbi:glycosyltransferase [uncultured Kordia sp.]|uniref:glycosyltransferase family 4 protein n=1 Tax=uncultured Kordia sp. TaxID=507699 RepID=UPI002615F3D7|nr:glycosyltransferase [uncultured Kordia sp.]
MSTQEQHIVFLTPMFPESEADSVSIPALQVFLKTIRKAVPHCKMTAISFQYPFTKKQYDWHGIDVIPLNGQTKRLKKLFVWNKALRHLKKLHKQQAITTIHSFWIGECSSIGQRFAKKHVINHVVTVMGQDALAGNLHVKYLLDTNTKLVTLSENHRNTLQQNYQLSSEIIPWYVDTTEYPEMQKNTIDVLAVGSLIDLKNYPLCIDVVSELVKKHPKLTVNFIGGGPNLSQLNSLIEQKELDKHITFSGEMHREKVLEHMATANILLHTSSYESFGYVYIEALYSGMVIVSKNVGFTQNTSEWAIANTKEEMVAACNHFLTKDASKKRVLVSSEKESLTDYLKLYNG